MTFTIVPKRVFFTLLCIIGTLAVLHIAQFATAFIIDDFEVYERVKMFDFDYEKNVPSLYSALAILLCASILWCIAIAKRRQLASFHWHWSILAIIFTYLGVDEALALHEEVGDFVEDLDLFDAEGFLYFAWVVPYAILMIVFVLSYLKFLLALPRQTAVLFVVSGAIFLTGAMGFEVFSARVADYEGFDTIAYHVLYTFEELCEMFGIALFCFALLSYIRDEHGEIRFSIE